MSQRAFLLLCYSPEKNNTSYFMIDNLKSYEFNTTTEMKCIKRVYCYIALNVVQSNIVHGIKARQTS